MNIESPKTICMWVENNGFATVVYVAPEDCLTEAKIMQIVAQPQYMSLCTEDCEIWRYNHGPLPLPRTNRSAGHPL